MAEVIALIDYGAGNLHSVHNALKAAGAEVTVTADANVVRAADRIVLPGVGAYADCRRGLDAVPGMVEALRDVVENKARPFLGICVGMQLLATRGVEHEDTQGFGWIDGVVKPIEPGPEHLKVPHMGWNTMTLVNPHPVLDGLQLGPDGLHAYFLHSFAFDVKHHADLVATADYGRPVTAIVARDNVVGTQFHPEKSQKLGLALLANFLKWAP